MLYRHLQRVTLGRGYLGFFIQIFFTLISNTPSDSISSGYSPFSDGVRPAGTVVYDYIFTGAGCAGLSLLVHLHRAGLLEGKKVLVIDQDRKLENDRTWCFWEQGVGPFEQVVYKSWEALSFYSEHYSGALDITPYTYKLIRGIDFYRHCFDILNRLPQISWLRAGVDAIGDAPDGAQVTAGGHTFAGKVVFNSIMPQRPALKKHHYWLLQHFKGWVVETDTDSFTPEQATLMDFRVGQEHGCTFVYVLPFSRRRALIEYTLFSEALLPKPAYDAALQQYLEQYLNISRFSIVKEEFGVIPMTNYVFPRRTGAVLNIGTAGGSTKASSGYTFRFIQKHAAGIVASLQQHGHPFAAVAEPLRFNLYDSVLLHILHNGQLDGAAIFARLFERNKGSLVLRFLDNETELAEELRLMATVPSYKFGRAAFEHIWARAVGSLT